jgi:hypothetical protein
MHVQQTWCFLPRVICETGCGAETDDCFRMREIYRRASRRTLFQMKIGLIHGPMDENDSGKQRNHELWHKYSRGGFITDMSNGDDSGAIVSTGSQISSDAVAARRSG